MTDVQQTLIPLGIGERLRQERVGLGLSAEDIAAALHIPLDVLEAVERDELDRFAPVYRRGYVLAYARHVGMDQEQITEMLGGLQHEAPALHSVFPARGRHNGADRWLKAASYVLASLLIGTLAWQVTHEAVRLSQRSDSQVPAAGQATAAGPAAGARDMSGPATHVNASIAALELMQEPAARISNAGEQAWSALQSAGQPGAGDGGLALGEHRLSVATSGDSWVEIVDADGQQLELDPLRGVTSREYRGMAPFRILFGRASAVDLHYDGQPIDIRPFTTGDVTQMTLGAEPAADDPAGAGSG
jgi:cytoskeleton protein RodZ